MPAASQPTAARLWCLLAGLLLTLGGVLGFLYESSFATGESMVSDEIAGVLDTNGWVNAFHLAIGLVALAAASRRPRQAALLLGSLLALIGLWGFAAADHGIGRLLDAFPVDSPSNLARLLIGVCGPLAASLDRPPRFDRALAALRHAGRGRRKRGLSRERPRRSGGAGGATD